MGIEIHARRKLRRSIGVGQVTDYAMREPCRKLIESFKDGRKFTTTDCAKLIGCNSRDLTDIMTGFKNDGFITAAVKEHRGNTWQKGLTDAEKALHAFNFNHQLESVK